MADHNFSEMVLFEKIAATIVKNGPLSLAKFISIALGDPDYGYYQKKIHLDRMVILLPHLKFLVYLEKCAGCILPIWLNYQDLAIQLSLSWVRVAAP